jgi:hypothetical protein
VAAAMLVAKGIWDPKTMVNVEELDPDPFIALLNKIGLPTEVKEIQPGSKDSFNGTVRSLEAELAESTATVTVSAANPMIALDPKAQVRGIQRLTAAVSRTKTAKRRKAKSGGPKKAKAAGRRKRR